MKPGSATLPFFGVEPVVLDPETSKELEGECSGYLMLRKPWPSIMRGVYEDHARFEETYFGMAKGYYFTGDGCKRDKDGYYWLTGRVDDVMNCSGHRIGTSEIESAVVLHESTAEAAVVGVPHEIKGEGIYCFVTLKDGFEYTDELKKELKKMVRSEIGAFATPDVIHWAPVLPKTRSGKMIPDSGSSDLVVPSADCGAEDGCIGSQHSKFDAQRSSTSQGPFGLVDVAYGQGETECEIIRDVARLDSLQVDQQDMLLVTTNRLAGYEYAMYDGILGLGTDKEARKGTPSFLTALPSADKFTICIGSRNKENGILLLGNATIDVLDWSPTLSFPARAIYTGDIPFWGVYMSSIKMSDGFSVDCQPSCAAVIDSGTSLMSLPSVMVYSLLDQIGNDYNADCSNVAAKLPNIVLTLEGQKFYLRPQDYMVVVDSDDLTDTGLINPISYDKLSTATQRIG